MSYFMDKITALRRKHYASCQSLFFPGRVWHITHCYHKKDFLLKFSKDRLRWPDEREV